MKRRDLTVALLSAAGPGWLHAALNESDAAAGVRAVLEHGVLAAVLMLGRKDGFLGNRRVRIPLPGHLETAAGLLRATGEGRRLDDLETTMNRAAEAAVADARTLFLSTVRAMSVEDALRLVRGGPTAATDFFAGKTLAQLGSGLLPIVTRAGQKLKLAERYHPFAVKAAGMGLARGNEASVQQHVTGRALDGVFVMTGDEEKKIRASPLQTGSALLQQVFGR